MGQQHDGQRGRIRPNMYAESGHQGMVQQMNIRVASAQRFQLKR